MYTRAGRYYHLHPMGKRSDILQNGSKSNQLIKIGRIDGDGIETLSVAGDIRITFSRP